MTLSAPSAIERAFHIRRW